VEPRVIVSHESGKQNVITDIVVGETGQDDSGIAAYRDTMIKLPAPTDSFVPFEEITPEWVAPFCQQASEEGGWHASIEAEIEAKKAAPVSAKFEWQKPQPEAE
tara:strand:+ start:240 stop:551 length:312 start_codon:yes stop_codon:yes gene_type:complete